MKHESRQVFGEEPTHTVTVGDDILYCGDSVSMAKAIVNVEISRVEAMKALDNMKRQKPKSFINKCIQYARNMLRG